MSAQEFVLAIMDRVLSWPVVVLVLGIVLRAEIRGAIGRITSVRAVGVEASFGEGIRAAEVAVESAVAQADSAEGGSEGPAKESDLPGALEGVIGAEEYPSAAILISWVSLERAINHLALVSHVGQGSGQAAILNARRLVQAGVVNGDFMNAVTQLNRLRAKVAHGLAVPTAGEAITFVSLAEELTRAAQAIADYRFRPDPDDDDQSGGVLAAVP